MRTIKELLYGILAEIQAYLELAYYNVINGEYEQ